MKVLVIPEDPTLDRHILKPIVGRIFADLGKSPRIDVLSNPRLRGVAQALDAAVLADIVSTFRMIDLFLVLVDRDGETGRHAVALPPGGGTLRPAVRLSRHRGGGGLDARPLS